MIYEDLTQEEQHRIKSLALLNAAKDCMPMAKKEQELTGDSGSVDVLENWIKITEAELQGKELPKGSLKKPVFASKEVTDAFKKAYIKHRTKLVPYN